MDRNTNEELIVLIKTMIVPLLKSNDFKKSNLNFNRSTSEVIQLINIQKSQYNHSGRTLFTINIGFFNSTIFHVSRDRIDQPKIITIDNCFVWGRSGHLIYKTDYWYELNKDTSYNATTLKVKEDFYNHIIPLFEKLQNLENIIDLLRVKIIDRPYHLVANIDDVAILELEFGDLKKGKEILTEVYQKAIIPKSTKSVRVYPDGKEDINWSAPSVNEFHVNKLLRIANHYNISF